VRRAVGQLMDLARTGNKYFNDVAPWSAVKTDRSRAALALRTTLELQTALAVLMEPFLPFSAEKLWGMLGAGGLHRDVRWHEIARLRLEPGAPLGKREILFAKIEDPVIDAQIAKLRGRE
jgi:methionyl-tRNA synthetase